MFNNFRIFVVIIFFIFLISILFSIIYSHISLDAPYYLSVARDISQGYIPYKDIYLSYTPLMMYLNALVHLSIEEFNYKIFLGFQYAIMLIAQLIYFRLLVRYLKFSILHALFLSLIVGIAILSADGTYINLEVYIFLAVISALFAYQVDKLFLTGIFLGISFILKQYGILNFVPFFFLIYFSKDRIFKNSMLLSSGAVATLIVFLFYFVIIQGISVLSILKQLIGYQYIQYATVRSPDLYTWLVGAKVFLILFIPLALILNKKLFSKKNLPWFIGVTVNILPTFLQAFQHYVILAFPYLFMLYALNYKSIDFSLPKSMLISGLALAVLLNLRIFRYQEVYSHQVATANVAKKIIPKDTEIFLNGDIRFLYCLNNYQNPLRKKIGYSYFHFLTEKGFTGIKILSPFPIENIETEQIRLVDQIFYLKL